jgi:hypothetical protein
MIKIINNKEMFKLDILIRITIYIIMLYLIYKFKKITVFKIIQIVI